MKLAAFFLFISLFCNGQVIKPGYIETNDGKKVIGLISYESNLSLYFGCNFKYETNDSLYYLTPDSISGYGFEDGSIYKSVSIPQKTGLQKVFIESIKLGRISQYKFLDRYFIIKDSQLYELVFTSSSEFTNRNLMTRLTQDCKLLTIQLQMQFPNNLKYIQSLIDTYNDCEGKEAVSTLKFGLRIMAGLDINEIKAEIGNIDFANAFGSGLRNSRLFTGGFEITVNHKRSNTITFSTGVIYSGREVEKTLSLNPDRIDQISISANTLSIPLYIVFGKMVSEKRVNPYFKIGMRNPIVLNSRSTWLSTIEIGNDVFVDKQPIFLNYKEPAQFSTGLGSGIRIGSKLNCFFEFLYNYGSRKISPKETFSLSSFVVQLGVTY
jgi:hypothetical protein